MKASNKVLTLVLILFFAAKTYSQQTYFIYLQNETKQAFAVTYNKKVYNSSPSGYLILPKLTNGNALFSVTFPKNLYPEQKLYATVNNNDAGYLLKNFADKGWGLFNMQTFAINMGNTTPPDVVIEEIKKPEIKKEIEVETKIDTTTSIKIIPEQPKDTIAEIKPAIIKNEEIPTNKNEVGVVKVFEAKGSTGVDLIYVDYTTKPYDTIQVFVPNGEVFTTKKVEMNTTVPTKINTFPIDKNDKRYYNQKCITLASEEDFNILRKKMAAETDDEKMVATAKKQFKLRCFTTEQLKQLSWLFLSERGKFSFFQAAQNTVYDIPNFPALETQFADTNYKQKFKALIK